MTSRDFRIDGIEPTFTGKVRDIYDVGDALLLVTTDRISAYDVILDQVIPEKGSILTQLTKFWLPARSAAKLSTGSSKMCALPIGARYLRTVWLSAYASSKAVLKRL